MAPEPVPSALPEPRRNALLRRVDWRFLLRGAAAPRAVELAPGPDSEALELVSEPASPGEAELAVAGFPSKAVTKRARAALAPGGEIVCRWRWPRLAGPRRARRRLLAAGFGEVRMYWAGPLPNRQPQFWLPLDSAAAASHLLASRPARSARQAVLIGAWRLVLRAGLLAPLYAVARAPGGEDEATRPASGLSAATPLLLLTGGHRSINKVVGLAFPDGEERPTLAVKFARVPEAEAGLEREAEVLARLGKERPDFGGAPALRGRGRRAGLLEVSESPVEGETMLSHLRPDDFGGLVESVTRLLVELAGWGGEAGPDRRERLIERPLVDFERDFGAALGAEVMAAARARLAGLRDDLPGACEHRDCSPWNVVLGADGTPTLLDWESAEPDGLPALDLVYFLANCVFVLDGAIESGRTDESYARLLDPSTPYGRVAAAAMAAYASAVGIEEDALARLRLLCWIVHSRSDYRHLELEVAGPPSRQALRGATFARLVEAELRRAQAL